MWFNPMMTFLLRSPLHPMLGDTMLITVTGRRTGRRYTLPVGFYREGEVLWIITNRDRTWWRNVHGGAEVSLRLRGVDVKGFAELVLDEQAVAGQVAEYVRHIPMAARSLGVKLENGTVDPAGAARAARDRLFVKVCVS